MKLGKWIALAVAAVILAEGIWGILVSLTRSLLLPLLARVLGGDSNSPLYLGPGQVNVPDLFASILQLCLAGIVFLLLQAWAGRAEEVRSLRPATNAQRPQAPTPSKPVPDAAMAAVAVPTATPAPPTPVLAPPAPGPVAAIKTVSPAPPKPVPAVPAVTSKPEEKPKIAEKPEKPREVYYNIVGEPLGPTEDE